MTCEDNQNRLEELRLLYQTAVADIAFFKQQQWRVTNYGLLLYAAIIAIPKVIEKKVSIIEYWILFILALVVLIAGLYMLKSLDEAINSGRSRLTESRKHFSQCFMTAWRGGKPENQQPDNPEDKQNLLWLFRSVFVISFLIVSWLLYRMASNT